MTIKKSEMYKRIIEMSEKINYLIDEVSTLSEEIWELNHPGEKHPRSVLDKPPKESKRKVGRKKSS